MKIKTFSISILLMIITVSIIYSNSIYNHRFKHLNVDNVINDSLRMITKDSIINYLKTLEFVKDSVMINKIDLNKIEKSLNQINYVKKSNVHFGINSKLKIKIDEREPVVEINSLNAYLDRDGEVVPKSNLIEIEVIKFFGKIDSFRYDKIANLGYKIMNDSFFKNHFNYIFSDSTELFIKPKKHSYTIELGNLNVIEKKLKNYKFFYASKSNENNLDEARTINLKFDNQVIVEKK